MAGATRRRYRQPCSAPDLIPLAIGTRLPPTAPALQTPPGDPRARQGQDSTQSPPPTRSPQPPGAGGRMHQRGLQRGAGTEAAARAPPGLGAAPPTHPARSPQSTAPLGTPATQSGHGHKSCTGEGPCRSPRDAGGERSPQPHPGTGGAGAWPWGQDRTPAGPAGSPRARSELWCVTALYIDKLKPLKLLNPSAESSGFIGAQPLPAPSCQWGGARGGQAGLGLSPPRNPGCTGGAGAMPGRRLGEMGHGPGTEHPDKGAARMPPAL